MVEIEITKEQYKLLLEYFTEYHPDIMVTLIECDDNLEKLGFCESAPCIVSLDLNLDSEKFDDILEQLIDFEIEACYDHPYPKDNFYIKRYEKFSWIYDHLLYLTHSDGNKADKDDNKTKDDYEEDISMENTFITITGVKHYYGMKPFKIGKVFKIVKEDDNEYDDEAIRAELPMIDTIGYVANSTSTVYAGTISAGRLYDKIDDYAYAQTMFITHSSVIALVLPPEEVEGPADTPTVKEKESKDSGKAKNKIGF